MTCHFTVNETLRIDTFKICWNIAYWLWMNEAPTAEPIVAAAPLAPR